MSETKPEIPPPMLDVAFDKWFAANEGPLLSAQATDGTIVYTAWNAAIEAAGVAEMAARIKELEAECGSGRCKQCGGTIDHYISCPKSKY